MLNEECGQNKVKLYEFLDKDISEPKVENYQFIYIYKTYYEKLTDKVITTKEIGK